METKHIVCFSNGHSSAIVTIEVVRKYGKENVILVNHGINPDKEESDIRRFGTQVSKYLDLPITYVNYKNIPKLEDIPDQFDIAIKNSGFKAPNTSDAICTNRLKTKPFHDFLEINFPDKNCIIYYGFDANEQRRITRRSSILGAMGYKSGYPLIWEERTIHSTKEIGIEPPNTYSSFKHANCTGCLKAGIQHWYVTYCTRYDIFCKAKQTEDVLGYTILRRSVKGELVPFSLAKFEPIFERMKCAGVPASEHIPKGEFAKYLKQYKIESSEEMKPCECSF